MREYAERRNWIVAMEVQEIGSGAKDRPQREELLKIAKRREIDLILVWRLDRWGRSVVDLLNTLQELQAIGVGFASLTEALDFTTPSGRAMAGLLAVFAEFEREILRDRVKAGIAEARKKGKPHGRPATARAFNNVIQQMRNDGISNRQIAKKLGIARSSVQRVIEEVISSKN
jgi:DNA invertase Pin-like site-specific DNA recombinase